MALNIKLNVIKKSGERSYLPPKRTLLVKPSSFHQINITKLFKLLTFVQNLTIHKLVAIAKRTEIFPMFLMKIRKITKVKMKLRFLELSAGIAEVAKR